MSNSSISAKAVKTKPTLETLCQAVAEHEAPVGFEHQGKRYVIMTEEEFEFYDEMEDHLWNKKIEEEQDDLDEVIPYEQARKELGLDE